MFSLTAISRSARAYAGAVQSTGRSSRFECFHALSNNRAFLHVNGIKQTVHFELVTQLLEPRLCKIIEVQAISAGIALPAVGIIEDEARNAFACGLSQKSAVVVAAAFDAVSF